MSPGFPESHGAFSFFIFYRRRNSNRAVIRQKNIRKMYFLTRHPVFLKKNKKIVTFLNIFLDGVKKCAKLK